VSGGLASVTHLNSAAATVLDGGGGAAAYCFLTAMPGTRGAIKEILIDFGVMHSKL